MELPQNRRPWHWGRGGKKLPEIPPHSTDLFPRVVSDTEPLCLPTLEASFLQRTRHTQPNLLSLPLRASSLCVVAEVLEEVVSQPFSMLKNCYSKGTTSRMMYDEPDEKRE